MRIGLIQVDGKWANLALMKLAAWHRARGDEVEWYNPLFLGDYDLVYLSKIFSFSPDYAYPVPRVVKGGSGYDLTTQLPAEIETCFPDYSIYDIDYAIGFTTRGCPRRCPFCIVPQKEGPLTIVGDIYSFWCGQGKIILLDNNLTAAPWEHFTRVLEQLINSKAQVDFSQGLDIRLLTDDHAALLKRVRLWKRIHFAWDNIHDEQAVRRGIDILKKHGLGYKVMFYVLIGYNTSPEEDQYRVTTLRSLGIDPFVMPFNRRDRYQRDFARWVNHKAIFKSVPWNEYQSSYHREATQ